jgi:hypothetical protein
LKNIEPEPPAVQRTIVHEARYDRATELVFLGARRADDALEGLEFFVSRRPEMGMAIRDFDPSEFASWVTKPLPEGRVRVIYGYDAQKVILLDAWLVPEGQF